ncbi:MULTISPECIES: helix-turn-helix domain-containing protein [Paracoccaceae]|jgi:AraC-like DNA-binding protein|nr:AraC family transcriptional regulator [Boseongicola sp. H5]MBO6603519.1 helix-turn-helix domain-containing protein [Roseicyclus sp.]MBO6626081.1 helix-turn-helix domain-containing protein [Roseicyclus sp.]MBO6924051.1 helix-turn-helix domain-containing protein [Roseicyclus sp.]
MSDSYAVTSLGQLRMRPTWRVETLHSNTRHHLYWITRGQGRVSVGCITRGYGPNTAVFVPAGTVMSLELPQQIQGLLLHMPPDPLAELPADPFHLRISNIEAQASLTGHIERIEREIAAQAPAQDRALRGYGLLVSTWITRELGRQEGAILRDRAHHLVEKFARLLSISYHTGAGVADYADRLGVTPTHLSRVCKEASGKPAHALIHERLMHEARRLLADTDKSARLISEELGFSSPAYFTRAFSQSTGRTPTAFRSSPRRN